MSREVIFWKNGGLENAFTIHNVSIIAFIILIKILKLDVGR